MSGDLEKIRAEQEKYLPETVYIQRLTRTADGTGGWSEAWTTAATTKGRIAPTQWKPEEGTTGGRMDNRQRYTVTLPAGADVTERDRLQIDGRQFEIIGVIRRSGETARRITCVEVR